MYGSQSGSTVAACGGASAGMDTVVDAWSASNDVATASFREVLDALMKHIGFVPHVRDDLIRETEDCDMSAFDTASPVEERCLRWLQISICSEVLQGLTAASLSELVSTVHERIDPMLKDGQSKQRLNEFLQAQSWYATERVRGWLEACCADFPMFQRCDSDFPAQLCRLTPGTWHAAAASPHSGGAASPGFPVPVFLCDRSSASIRAAAGQLSKMDGCHYYHGTSWEGALHIGSNGISIGKRHISANIDRYDFDDRAFYTTPQLDNALQYAFPSNARARRGAVLVYADFAATVAADKHLQILDDHSEHWALWERAMILAHTKGKIDVAVNQYHIVTAPICANAGAVRNAAKPLPSRDDFQLLHQVVVRDDSCENNVNTALLGVIFVKSGTGSNMLERAANTASWTA